MQRREFIGRLGVAAVGAIYGSSLSCAQATSSVAHRTIGANGIHLHFVEQGEGPLIVLCHGFPELWYSWRHQLPALSAAGFHAVAVDMRGYGQSDRPEATESDHDARTDRVIKEILSAGEAFFGGVNWRGRRCMRISVSNWQTSERDVDRAVEAVARAIETARVRMTDTSGNA